MNPANPIATITRRSLDELEDHIVSISSHLSTFEYEFLVSIRELVLRQGWKAYHFNHCSNGSRCCG
jgi:hypothetical protein